MKIERTSPFSNITHVVDIDVSEEQLHRWRNGELMQDAMPNLTVDEREFIMTGITPGEWNTYLPSDEG